MGFWCKINLMFLVVIHGELRTLLFHRHGREP
jgi:hypothetical protein